MYIRQDNILFYTERKGAFLEMYFNGCLLLNPDTEAKEEPSFPLQKAIESREMRPISGHWGNFAANSALLLFKGNVVASVHPENQEIRIHPEVSHYRDIVRSLMSGTEWIVSLSK